MQPCLLLCHKYLFALILICSLYVQPKKQATKGQKQILDENNSTLDFYAKVMISIEVRFSVIVA